MRALCMTSRIRWCVGCLFVVAILASGCYQPAGGVLEGTSQAQGAPTFTPIPTETSPPTETLLPTDILLPTETLFSTETPATLVADANLQDGGFSLTATQFSLQQTQAALLAQGINPDVDDFAQPDQFQQLETPTPDLFATATAIILQATLNASFPFTETAIALQTQNAFPTPTPTQPNIVVPTQGGPVPVGEDCVHEVRLADRNMFRIGLAYGVTYQQIAQYNNIVNPALIYVGQRLIIPGCGTTGFQPPPTSTPTTPFATQNPIPTDQGDRTCNSPYLVEQGDTLFQISLECNRSVISIANANSIVNPNLIFVNDQLTIP